MRRRILERFRNHRTVDRRRDESGSVLVLALVYLVAVSLIVGGLTDWAMNDLNNTSNFTSARSLQTAASSATETAIQSIRYSPLLGLGQTLNASPPTPCWGSGASSGLTTLNGNAVDGVSMDVWCSTVWNPTSANTRVVTLSTCSTAVTTSAATCAATPLLQARVTFDDYPPGVNTPTTALCVVFCGSGMTLNSWVWSPAVPVVQGLSWSLTPLPTIAGGTSITVNGKGFVPNATTVNFVEEVANTPSSLNVTFPGTVVANSVSCVALQCSLTAISPAITTGLTFYVTVTTPTGTSAYGPNDIFTFTPSVVPIVSLVGPIPVGNTTAGGSTGGGTPITITGTGFFSGATVKFVPSGGGTGIPATSVGVVGPNMMTAYSPPASAGAYYVVVTTPGGSSSTGSLADEFTYAAPIPNPSGS
jgi:hypothetical protein